LHGKVVGLDTAPLIYFIEEHPVFLPIVLPFFEAVQRGDIRVVTSTITLGEVLVKPLRLQNTALRNRYERILLTARGFAMLPVTTRIARLTANLRSQRRVKTPDALQIATSLDAGATAFLTNDSELPQIEGLRTIVLKELAATSSK